jgi:transposase
MAEPAANTCAGCQRLQEQLERLRAAVTRLEEQLAAARKDSSTSSKPPSSDIVKPPAPLAPGQDQRKPGGQPGHPLHERALFPADQIDLFLVHPLQGCPCCGGLLCRNGQEALVVQQVDLQPAKLTVEQHTCPEYWCAGCERSYKAGLPRHVTRGGLVGPRLTTLIAYLKGFCHASYSTVRLFLRDVVGVTISRGQLSKIIGKVSTALDEPYRELLEALPG